MTRIWLLLILAGLVLGQGGSSDIREIELVLRDLQPRPWSIAIPDFKREGATASADVESARKTLGQVIRTDLAVSGFLKPIDLTRFEGLKDPHAGPIDFDEWKSVEADHLVVGSLLSQGDQIRVEVRLYEVSSRKHILAKAYRGKPGLARKMAHVISDDIMSKLRNVRFATSKIVYTVDTPVKGEANWSNKELAIMDYDGFGSQPLTKGGISFAPTAIRSEGDTMLAYSVFDQPGTSRARYSIYLKPTLFSPPKPLLRESRENMSEADVKKVAQGMGRATSPALSPDGKKIAFSMAKSGNTELYVMNLDGSDFIQLTRDPGVDTNPAWSPGGNAILFTSDRTGSPQVYQMDADGLNLRRITNENAYNDSAVWNPVHEMIAYVSRFDGNFDIFIMDLRSGKNYRLTANQGSNEDPSWSPDGNQICFTSNRGGSWQIYAASLTGQNLRQITKGGNNRAPVWVGGE